MQGILCLILVAACIKLSSTRPRLKTAGDQAMLTMWPRPDSHKIGFSTILHHHNAHLPKYLVSQPYSLEPRHPIGMNPHLDASVRTKESRLFLQWNIKRLVQGKPIKAVKGSWNEVMKISQDSHHKVRHRLPRNYRQVSRRHLNTSNKWNILRLRRGSSRTKRSVRQRTLVEYNRTKNVKFRKQRLPLYLMPDPSGNSIRMDVQHMNHACFRAHIFREATTNQVGGNLVMLQAQTNSYYLQSNSSGFLSLVNSEEGAANVTHVDNRFFRLISQIGDTVIRIKHINTNLHLQARGNEVSLVSSDPLTTEGMHFEEYSCSAT